MDICDSSTRRRISIGGSGSARVIAGWKGGLAAEGGGRSNGGAHPRGSHRNDRRESPALKVSPGQVRRCSQFLGKGRHAPVAYFAITHRALNSRRARRGRKDQTSSAKADYLPSRFILQPGSTITRNFTSQRDSLPLSFYGCSCDGQKRGSTQGRRSGCAEDALNAAAATTAMTDLMVANESCHKIASTLNKVLLGHFQLVWSSHFFTHACRRLARHEHFLHEQKRP